MKQKYKVFINDQEIVFRHKKSAVGSNESVLPIKLTPLEIFRELASEQIFPRTYVAESEKPGNEFRKFISYFKLVEAAGGIVRKENENGDLLVIFRLGKWDLPKGKLDGGETPENAAKREVEEECGIGELEIIDKVADTYHIYEHKGKIIVKKTYWYSMVTNDKRKPMAQKEEGIEEVRWVNTSELLHLLPQSYASVNSLIRENILNS